MKSFFSYDENQGFERHETAAAAKADAESALEMYRDDAGDGWSDEVGRVCWGLVIGTVSETERRERCPDTDCDGECDRDVHHCNDYDVQIEYAVVDAESELTRLRADLTALRERMRWVPVSERLPEDGVDVLAVSNSGVTDAYVLFDMDGLPDWRRGDYQIRGVTHWQPLPAAPEVQGSPSSHSKEVRNV